MLNGNNRWNPCRVFAVIVGLLVLERVADASDPMGVNRTIAYDGEFAFLDGNKIVAEKNGTLTDIPVDRYSDVHVRGRLDPARVASMLKPGQYIEVEGVAVSQQRIEDAKVTVYVTPERPQIRLRGGKGYSFMVEEPGRIPVFIAGVIARTDPLIVRSDGNVRSQDRYPDDPMGAREFMTTNRAFEVVAEADEQGMPVIHADLGSRALRVARPGDAVQALLFRRHQGAKEIFITVTDPVDGEMLRGNRRASAPTDEDSTKKKRSRQTTGRDLN